MKMFWVKLTSILVKWVFPTTLLISIEHIDSVYTEKKDEIDNIEGIINESSINSKVYENDKRKQGSKQFTVSMVLTTRRYDLLHNAKEEIENYQEEKFSFANVNTQIQLKEILEDC